MKVMILLTTLAVATCTVNLQEEWEFWKKVACMPTLRLCVSNTILWVLSRNMASPIQTQRKNIDVMSFGNKTKTSLICTTNSLTFLGSP